MDYSFNITTTSKGALQDMYGTVPTPTIYLTQTISNNILHVGCFCANFTGWNN